MKRIQYNGTSSIISRIAYLLNRKAPLPLDGDGDAVWGTNGQVLTTDGNGNTSWTTPQGGGGDVTDVEVNGTSVVNAQGVAEVSVPTKTSDLNNDSGFIDGTDLSTALSDYTPTSGLAAVATSGSYNDLSNKPTIPAAQVNSDWNAVSGVEQILNKPTLATVATSGSYNDLSNKPTIPAAQIQSDWNQSDTTAKDYIKNKPTIPSSSGHTIWNRIKTALTSRVALWFADASVSDASADGATKVEVVTELASESDFDNLATDGTEDGVYCFPDSGEEYLTADNIGFDNTNTGLSATVVQDAICEVNVDAKSMKDNIIKSNEWPQPLSSFTFNIVLPSNVRGGLLITRYGTWSVFISNGGSTIETVLLASSSTTRTIASTSYSNGVLTVNFSGGMYGGVTFIAS